MKNYKELLRDIIGSNIIGDNQINFRDTRSGECTGVFARQLKWDLRKGFPAVTTKKLFMNSVIGELLWFLQGSTNISTLKALTGLSEDDWCIWSNDAQRSLTDDPTRFNGNNLGEMYGVQWRAKRVPVCGHIILEEPLEDLDKDYIPVGKGTVQNGIGINDVDNSTRDYKNIYSLWRGMLERCYGNKKVHENHRRNNVTVSPRWLQFSNFLEDVYHLSGFQNWVSNPSGYCLDKDYFGGKVYSKNTCIFLERHINSALCDNTKVFTVDSGSDMKVLFGLKQLALYFGFKETNTKNLEERLRGSGYNFKEVTGDGVLYRPKIFIDQFQNLINGLIDNPTGRDHIVDSWNPNHKTVCSLAACHQMFQCYVTDDGYLDLLWNQRSVDTFLGLPFNIASYALLSHIIARLTGYKVRYLSCMLGDVHLYEKHFDQALQLLEREPYSLPKLGLGKLLEVKTLKDLEGLTSKNSGIKLIDYVSHSELKADLEVGG